MTVPHAEIIAEKLREGNRLEAEITDSKLETQRRWLEFLNNPSGRQET